MIVQPSNLAALTWAGAAAGTLSEGWRVGSVLSGRVIDRSAQGRLILQVGALTVEAEIADSSPPPQQFQARVLSNGAIPLLELMDTPAQSPLASLLRSHLPRQGGYAPLLAQLDTLARRPQVRQLPEPARFALAMLEASVNRPEDLSSAHGLRHAIQRSGLFFESDLARVVEQKAPASVLDHDWKGSLLRVVRILERLPVRAQVLANGAPEAAPPMRFRALTPQPRAPLPPPSTDPVTLLAGLREHGRAALARLEIAQIEAHPIHAPGTWLVELPVRSRNGCDVLQVRIQRESPEHDGSSHLAEQGPWTLGFAIDLPSLGPIQAEIRLEGTRVQARIWVTEEASVQRLEAQLQSLGQILEQSGLQLAQLQCRRGVPQPSTTFSAPLVDASA